MSQEGSPGPTRAAVASSGRAQSLPPSLHKCPNVAPSTWQRGHRSEAGRMRTRRQRVGPCRPWTGWAARSHWAPGTFCRVAGPSSAAQVANRLQAHSAAGVGGVGA